MSCRNGAPAVGRGRASGAPRRTGRPGTQGAVHGVFDALGSGFGDAAASGGAAAPRVPRRARSSKHSPGPLLRAQRQHVKQKMVSETRFCFTAHAVAEAADEFVCTADMSGDCVRVRAPARLLLRGNMPTPHHRHLQ